MPTYQTVKDFLKESNVRNGALRITLEEWQRQMKDKDEELKWTAAEREMIFCIVSEFSNSTNL
jgi:hypothetical protein